MTSLIPIEQILIKPNRQRRKFDESELQELVTSIRDSAHGLLHPIVVRREGDQSYLVAGERRLRAIKDIYALGGTFLHNSGALTEPVPEGLVPVVDLGELSELEAESAELEENIRRADLTWQERAEATARLANFLQKRAVVEGTTPPSHVEIALEAKPDITRLAAIDSTRKELVVSKHLDDPEVKAAKSLGEAYKVLKKKEEVSRNRELAATIGESYTTKAHLLLNRDSKEVLCEELADKLYDVILSDPPYGMGADEFGDSGQGVGAAAHFYKDDYETWCGIMDWFVPQTFRLAKPDAHLYLFCDIDRFHELRERVTRAGWTPFRTPLIWSNPDGYRAPWPEHGPQRKYECILFAKKGDRKVNSVRPDVLEYKKDTALGHPAQKPVALLVDLLKRSTKPGDSVLDAFGGSGPVLAAAHELKLYSTVIEQDSAAFAIAAKRLQALFAQPELAPW